jgi:phage terminase small subunit
MAGLTCPEEWDDDLAVAISSVEVVTRNFGNGEVERVHKIKAWNKNSALEKTATHLGCPSSGFLRQMAG